MVEWFDEAEHYSVVHFAIENGIGKEELFKIAGEDEYFREKLDYALSVQEYKVSEGAISGKIDRATALEMLKTYNGWKNAVDYNIGGQKGNAIKLCWVIDGKEVDVKGEGAGEAIDLCEGVTGGDTVKVT
jgi:hypothetical protein